MQKFICIQLQVGTPILTEVVQFFYLMLNLVLDVHIAQIKLDSRVFQGQFSVTILKLLIYYKIIQI